MDANPPSTMQRHGGRDYLARPGGASRCVCRDPASRCACRDPLRLLLYNRLPKTASGTLDAMLTTHLQHGRFENGGMWPRDLDQEETALYGATLRNLSRTTPGGLLVYVRHIFYCDLAALLGPNLATAATYINVWREPVARAVSIMNWNRLGSLSQAEHPEANGSTRWNTRDDAFSKVHNQYLRWNCGFRVHMSLVGRRLTHSFSS